MDERQYESLCATCDSILLAPDSTLGRMAIAWLHVLNEHPSNLAQYSGAFAPRQENSLHPIRSFVSQARQWFRSRQHRKRVGEVAPQADVLFVSHLLNASQVGKEDFYFGRLPEILNQEGISSCVALRSGARIDANALDAGWPRDMAPRVVLPDSLSGLSELAFRRSMSEEGRRLRAEAKRCDDLLRRRLYVEAARQALSNSSIATLRFYYQILDLAAKLRVKAIVLTYEGHAWERLAFAAARAIVPGVRCIGYHHTILFPRQHAVLRPLGNRYDPDVVLTAGDISRGRFRQSYRSRPVQVESLGIHRRQSDVTQTSPASITDKGVAICLVIPDGIMSEALYLINFAVKSASQMPRVRFVVRLHPVMSFEALTKEDPGLRHLPGNVEFSRASIMEDFARSRWAIYRGSNAAVYAVMAGLRPFYAEKQGEMRIDSLHELHSWKKVVKEPGELVRNIELDLVSDSRGLANELAAAADYCRRYFMPSDPRVLLDAIR